MENFNLDFSYAIVSAIRAGVQNHVTEDENIGYDIETAERIFRKTSGYELMKTLKFIENNIGYINDGCYNNGYRLK